MSCSNSNAIMSKYQILSKIKANTHFKTVGEFNFLCFEFYNRTLKKEHFVPSKKAKPPKIGSAINLIVLLPPTLCGHQKREEGMDGWNE